MGGAAGYETSKSVSVRSMVVLVSAPDPHVTPSRISNVGMLGCAESACDLTIM